MKIGQFPDVINDNAARVVAFFVAALATAALVLESRLLTGFLLLGFLSRVLYGPRFDVLARIAIHGVLPALRIGNRPTAGAPKRFAQFIGLLFSSSALLLLLSGHSTAFQAVLGTLTFFALLESTIGFCAGCFAFALLIKVGAIPEHVCERCNTISARGST